MLGTLFKSCGEGRCENTSMSNMGTKKIVNGKANSAYKNTIDGLIEKVLDRI